MDRITLNKMVKGDTGASDTIKFNCLKCKDLGYIILGDGIEKKAQICTCQDKEKYSYRRKKAKLSRLLEGCTFQNFNFDYYSKIPEQGYTFSNYELAKSAYDAAQKFVLDYQRDKNTNGILLIGNPGRGKTYLAASIVNELILSEEEINILFIIVPELLNDIRSSYNQQNMANMQTENQIIDSARQADVLVLDDLGAHTYNQWVMDKLYSIIDYRLQEKLPTIITSNLVSTNDMNDVLGNRLTSRIYQLCRIYKIDSDNDIRLVNAYKDMKEINK